MPAEILYNPAEAEAAHTILTRDFTDRYLQAAHLSKVTYSAPYNASNPLCDYQKTWWESRPNRFTPHVAHFVLGKLLGLSKEDMESEFYAPFESRAEEIRSELEERPVMIVTGHEPDVMAALPVIAASAGIARKQKQKDFQRNFADMLNISHVVATRGFAPVMIGKGHLSTSLVRIAQMGLNPHFVFPKNERMKNSGISEEFIHEYNSLGKRNMVDAGEFARCHPDGLNLLWGMAPGGTRDLRTSAMYQGEEMPVLITNVVEEATVKLIQRLGCSILPVCTSVGGSGSHMRIGKITRPNKINQAKLDEVMSQLAAFRRKHGEGQVYYAKDDVARFILSGDLEE